MTSSNTWLPQSCTVRPGQYLNSLERLRRSSEARHNKRIKQVTQGHNIIADRWAGASNPHPNPTPDTHLQKHLKRLSYHFLTHVHGPTDQRMDRRTNRSMDNAPYRVGCPQLKSVMDQPSNQPTFIQNILWESYSKFDFVQRSFKKFDKILIFQRECMEMCLHGNQHPSSIKHTFISYYSKYQSARFICLPNMNSPVILILDDIYCTKFIDSYDNNDFYLYSLQSHVSFTCEDLLNKEHFAFLSPNIVCH